MDISAYLTPWNLGGGIAGLVLSLATVISLVRSRRHVGSALVSMSTRLFSQIGFFSLVIVVFMVISVLESGEFFNDNITHHAFFGLLGYALALGFDLVSIVCMLARLNAERMRDERGSRLNLVGVIICAVVSAFANACGSLQGFTPINLDHTPLWMQFLAPWLSMVFPAMIIILSMTTDHMLDHAPTSGVDVATFRAREQKRVDLLQVRLDTERALLALETELSTLRRSREQASGRVPREWIMWRWLRPTVPAQTGITRDELTAAIDQAMYTVRTTLDERVEELSTTLRTLDAQVRTWATKIDRPLAAHVDHLQEQVDTLDHVAISELDRDRKPEEQVGRDMAPTPEPPGPQDTSVGSVDSEQTDGPEQQEGMAARILATLRQLGMSTPDTRIAREVGCSRKTVARWRKRWQEQGMLAVVAQSEENGRFVVLGEEEDL